jgi:transposase
MVDLILPAHLAPQSQADWSAGLPRPCAQALFDVLSHFKVGDVRNLLVTWTTMAEGEIQEVDGWLDALYQRLSELGLKPKKVRREVLDAARDVLRKTRR